MFVLGSCHVHGHGPARCVSSANRRLQCAGVTCLAQMVGERHHLERIVGVRRATSLHLGGEGCVQLPAFDWQQPVGHDLGQDGVPEPVSLP